jgi:hypothetical protein
MSPPEHPLSDHVRWVTGGVLGFVCFAALWLIGGDKVWANPAHYLFIALGAAALVRGLWIWPK